MARHAGDGALASALAYAPVQRNQAVLLPDRSGGDGDLVYRGGPPRKNHVNWVVYDSEWEAEFCRVVESNGRVIAYTKNHNLGFEVPYRYQGTTRRCYPDFILLVDDGRGADDPLHLVVEIKGYRGEDAKDKASTMKTYWIPGVNNLGTYGRWAFAEFTDIWGMETDLAAKIGEQLEGVIDG